MHIKNDYDQILFKWSIFFKNSFYFIIIIVYYFSPLSPPYNYNTYKNILYYLIYIYFNKFDQYHTNELINIILI